MAFCETFNSLMVKMRVENGVLDDEEAKDYDLFETEIYCVIAYINDKRRTPSVLCTKKP